MSGNILMPAVSILKNVPTHVPTFDRRTRKWEQKKTNIYRELRANVLNVPSVPTQRNIYKAM